MAIGFGGLGKVWFAIHTNYIYKMHIFGIGTSFFPTHISSYLQVFPEEVVWRQQNYKKPDTTHVESTGVLTNNH